MNGGTIKSLEVSCDPEQGIKKVICHLGPLHLGPTCYVPQVTLVRG